MFVGPRKVILSMQDRRESTKRALENFFRKQIKKPRKKRNSAPEKDVESEVLTTARQMGFLLFVYESKATFNPKVGRYLKSNSVVEGHPDLAGITPCGRPCYIELKAKGKLSTVRQKQDEFLKAVIDRGAFALVLDSSTELRVRYDLWKASIDQKAYLLSLLN